jgi:hypothetical protein
METSYLLARVIGISWLILFAAMFINREFYKRVWQDVISHPASLIISGLLILVCGLLIINVHPHWTLDWRGLITLTGWMLTVGGAARLIAPKQVLRMAEKMQKNSIPVYILSGFMLLVGLCLTWVGFKL